MRFATAFLFAFFASLSVSQAQVPVYEVTPVESSITFGVESSVPIKGTSDKCDAKMTFTSTDMRSRVLEIKIHADSVDIYRIPLRPRADPYLSPRTLAHPVKKWCG